MRFLTTSIPRSSDAFNSNTPSLNESPSNARASARTLVVFPVPGGPDKIKFGMFPCCARISSLPTVSSLPTISLTMDGRYFSSHCNMNRKSAQTCTQEKGDGGCSPHRLLELCHRDRASSFRASRNFFISSYYKVPGTTTYLYCGTLKVESVLVDHDVRSTSFPWQCHLFAGLQRRATTVTQSSFVWHAQGWDNGSEQPSSPPSASSRSELRQGQRCTTR